LSTSIIPAEPQPVRAVAQSMTPMGLLQAAIDSGTPLSEMKELYALVQQMRLDEAQERFAERLAEFQRDCPRIHKSRKTQGNFSFGYASLDDIDEKIRPILGRLNIVVAFDSEHTTANNENVINVTVRVRVGSYYEDRKFGCPIPKDLRASDSQKWGAALSYAKRYALCAALNIVVTDEDDESKLGGGTIDADQATELELLIRDVRADEAKFLAWAGVKSIADLPAGKYPEAVRMLRAKKGGAK